MQKKTIKLNRSVPPLAVENLLPVEQVLNRWSYASPARKRGFTVNGHSSQQSCHQHDIYPGCHPAAMKRGACSCSRPNKDLRTACKATSSNLNVRQYIEDLACCFRRTQSEEAQRAAKSCTRWTDCCCQPSAPQRWGCLSTHLLLTFKQFS